jgi:hypothetical protein
MNLYSACTYSKERGSSCISKETVAKITSSSLAKLNPKILTVLANEPGTVGELNILLDERVIKLLGEDLVIAELDNFKPIGPTDTKLMSNFDEDNMLRHFAKFDPSFIAVTVQLMDFPEPHYKFSNELTGFLEHNKAGLLSGDTKTFGCVLNTLRSDGSLSKVGHWVAMFGDFRGEVATIEYFNSSGKSAPKDVFLWMEGFATDFTTLTGKRCIAVNVSNIVHQKSNTECGAYSIYFIAARLIGYSYKKFREKNIDDDVVTRFRSNVLISSDAVTNLGFIRRKFA